MQKIILITGAALAGLSVLTGAFGAHALKKILEASGYTDTFETAVRYQFYHAFALLILGLLMMSYEHQYLNYSYWSFLIGTVLFSGSLYVLCLTGISKLGMITPFGGIVLIAGWVWMILGIYKAS